MNKGNTYNHACTYAYRWIWTQRLPTLSTAGGIYLLSQTPDLRRSLAQFLPLGISILRSSARYVPTFFFFIDLKSKLDTGTVSIHSPVPLG